MLGGPLNHNLPLDNTKNTKAAYRTYHPTRGDEGTVAESGGATPGARFQQARIRLPNATKDFTCWPVLENHADASSGGGVRGWTIAEPGGASGEKVRPYTSLTECSDQKRRGGLCGSPFFYGLALLRPKSLIVTVWALVFAMPRTAARHGNNAVRRKEEIVSLKVGRHSVHSYRGVKSRKMTLSPSNDCLPRRSLRMILVRFERGSLNRFDLCSTPIRKGSTVRAYIVASRGVSTHGCCSISCLIRLI